MYMPPQFTSEDRAVAIELMRTHAFASLVSTDDDGLPFITHLPLALEEVPRRDAGLEMAGAPIGDPGLVLHGHCAKPNPHWRYLRARPRAVVSFMGPHAYLSPTVYPDLARVPTWNYLAVQCTVEARLIDDADAKDALLKRLIAQHEPAYARQWRELEPRFQQAMLGGIVGFELRIVSWQCKLKLNQHRREAHAAMHAVYRDGSPDEQALAGWMTRLGMKVGIEDSEHH